MSKLDEMKELWRLQMLQLRLANEVTAGLEKLKPQSIAEEAEELRLKVIELEMITKEVSEKWKDWKAKYDD